MFINILPTYFCFTAATYFSFLLSSGKVIISDCCRQNHCFVTCDFLERDTIKASRERKIMHEQEGSFSCLLLICFPSQMLLTLFKINRNKNMRNNPKAFTDAGISDDMHFPACLSSTVLVYHHFRHHRQQSLAKMITVKGHTSLSNLSGPFCYESFTTYMRKGREQHYNVRVNADLHYVSTVQTTGAQEGSSQNGTCARSATHWP